MLNRKKDLFDEHFDRIISEQTGIPENELTLEKIQALVEANDFPAPPHPTGRISFTRAEITRMQQENDRFLKRQK